LFEVITGNEEGRFLRYKKKLLITPLKILSNFYLRAILFVKTKQTVRIISE